MTTLASRTSNSAALAGPPDVPHPVRLWTPVGHQRELGREGEHLVLVVEDGVEILLLDHVLRPDLPGRELSTTDPAADRLRVAIRAPRSLGHRQHSRILQHL